MSNYSVQRLRLGLVAVVATALVACGGPSDGDLIAEARKQAAAGDHANAAIQLKSLLQRNPSSAEGRFLLGSVLVEQGAFGAALVELKKAEELGYSQTHLSAKQARALIASGKFKEVVATYGDMNLPDADAQAEMKTAVAVAQIRLGKAADADVAIEEALKARPADPWALMTKARLVAVKGDIDKALALIEQSKKPGTPNGEAWQLQGDILLRVKRDHDGAIKAYRQALLDPREAMAAHASLVFMHMLRKDLPAVKAQFQEMKKAFPKHPNTLLTETQIAYLDKDFERARELVQQLLRFAPSSQAFLILAGAIELQRGSLVAAETHLGKAVQTSARLSAGRRMLAEVYRRQGQPERALSALRPLLESNQPDPDALLMAGETYLTMGEVRSAEAAFTLAGKMMPTDPSVKTALALTDLLKGKTDAAFDSLQSIAASDPGETADLALIGARMRRREWDAALKAIASLEQKQPTRSVAKMLRGQVLKLRGDAAGARAAFESVLSIDAGSQAAFSQLAALDVSDGKPEQARKRLEQAIKASPTSAEPRLAIAALMSRQGAKPADIESWLSEGIRAIPSDASLRVALVNHFIDSKNFNAAVDSARAALVAIPENTDILDALARAQGNAGDDMQAIAGFNKVAGMLPKSITPHLRLADLYAKRNNIPARTASVMKAFELAPESPVVHKQLLALVAQTRDPKPALAAAKDLQKRFPARASGYMLEGDVESARKSWASALTAYQKALTLPDRPIQAPISLYVAYVAAGRQTDADRFANDWLKSHPEEAAFSAHLGSVAMARKDFPAAERHYARVLSIDPDDILALNNVAWLMSERKAPEALGLAERAAKLAPGSALVLDTLAKALAANGNLDKAIEVQTRAVELSARRPDFRIHLARLLIASGDNGKARAKEILDPLAAGKEGSGVRSEATALLKGLGA